VRKVFFYLKQLGLNPLQFISFISHYPGFIKDLRRVKEQLKQQSDFSISKLYPCLFDKDAKSGSLAQHYFYQDLYVAQKIFEMKPIKHVDIGSRIDGFVAHLAVFREVEVFDIRSLDKAIPNVSFTEGNISDTKFSMRDYTDSLSSLHVLEHFGLGRYGDPININSHIEGFENFYHLLKPGGIFYFSVPIGPQRIEFNAHRVFSITYLLQLFKDKFEVLHFSYVDDHEVFHKEVELTKELIENNFACNFGCGIFVLKKLASF